ncbi:MAG: hypothetical protein ACE3JT_09560 [Acinetobacter radioresistens]
MISDVIDTTTFLLKDSSPLVIFIFLTILVAYKGQNIINFFFEVKDLPKNRLVKKLKTEIEIGEVESGNSELKKLLGHYYKELQLQALIGDPNCSIDLAQYILTRQEIYLAISRYKISKDLIIFDQKKLKPIMSGKFPAWRIHTNWIVGLLIYLVTSLISALPYLYYSFLDSTSQLSVLKNLSLLHIIILAIFSIFVFIAGFFCLTEGLKPLKARRFCEMPSYIKTENIYIDK